jgi:hypothetical protein
MSEFLQDLLKKVKQSADALEVPVVESDSKSDSTPDVGPKQKKRIKPSSHPKPVSEHENEGEPSSANTPGSLGESGVADVSGLPPKPGSLTTPGLATKSDSESGLPAEPGSLGESGVVAVSGLPPKPGLLSTPGLVPESDGESGFLTEPGSLAVSAPLQLLKTFADSRAAINAAIPPMKDSELHLYHYLAERTYGNQRTQSDGVITYSQKEAMKATGIKSTATIVKAMTSLCKKKLVKWVRKARKRGEISQVRVFLPEDVQEFRVRSDASTSE